MKKSVNFLLILFFVITFSQAKAQTTITLQPGPNDGNDASIWSGAVTASGDRESLIAYTWTNSGNIGLKRAFLAFDYSSIPENALITNAKLSLYYNPTDPIENFDVHTGENDIYIQRIISEWDEHTIIWDNQPGITMENQVELPPSISSTQDYLDIDVTDLVIDMLDTSNGNYGFMIRMKDELNFYKSVLFASSDHDESALHPKLEISYLPDTTYCITLKPNADEGKDARVWETHPNTNYANHYSVLALAWTHNGIPGLTRNYIDFDFSQIPSNTFITYAELVLFNDSTSLATNGEHSQLSGPNQIIVNRVVDPWNEHEITWNNVPGFTTQNQVIVPSSSSPHQNYHINVTALVQDILEDTTNSYGFRLQLQTEHYYRSVVFASSDHIDSTLHPELKICYSTTIVTVDDEADIEFKLFPNPTHTRVTVECNFEDDISIQFINSQGQVIRNMANIQQTETIDISGFSKGIYFVRLFNEDMVAVKKLIVN